jgi:hypothetical protein
MALPNIALELLQNQAFHGVNIAVSGRRFEGCTFEECNMLYAGGPCGFKDIKIHNCRWVAIGPLADVNAGRALEAMAADMKKTWQEIKDRQEGPPAIDGHGNTRGI